MGDVAGGALEGMAVARAKKIALPPGSDTIVSTIQGVPPIAKSSMLQDLERGGASSCRG